MHNFNHRMDLAIEGAWLLVIFAIPLIINPYSLNAFYFIKALVLVFLVCLMLGLVIARWLINLNRSSAGSVIRSILASPLQVTAVVFGLLWVISTIFSIMPFKSIWGNLGGSVGMPPNLAFVFFFLVIANNINRRSQVFRALYVLLLSSAVVSLIGVIQYFHPGILPWFRFQGRVFSTDGNPLFLSSFLSMTMPITLAMIILHWYGTEYVRKNKLIFSGLLLLFGLQFCCLAMAQYSLTLLLFVVGIFLFLGLISVLSHKKTAIILTAVFLLSVAALAGTLLGPMLGADQTFPAANNEKELSMAEQAGLPTLSIRVQSWKAAANIIIESPEIASFQDNCHWLRRIIGYGPETVAAVMQTRFPDSLKGFYTFSSIMIAQPENHYLFLGVTIGLLGLLTFLMLLFHFFLTGFRLLIRNDGTETIMVVAALIAAVGQYCVYTLLNASVITSELVFWLALALVSAVWKMKSSRDMAVSTLTGQLPIADDISTGSVNRRLLVPSVILIVLFVLLGASITIPPLVANMKVQMGLNAWSRDRGEALTLVREATLIEPHQAYYLNFAGSVAFTWAKAENILERKAELLEISKNYYLEAIKQEPQMAVWYSRLGDVETYQAVNGNTGVFNDAIHSYEQADIIFPENPVILNKLATAYILSGDRANAISRLEDSRRSDPSWLQTKYFEGLMEVIAGNDQLAGELFLSPGQNHYEEIKYFIDFCHLASEYRKIEQVKKALVTYIQGVQNNWISFAFLGIASVYDESLGPAVEAFRHSADLVTPDERKLLAGAIHALTLRHESFRQAGSEILNDLVRSPLR